MSNKKMKRLQLPKSKFLKLIINVVLIAVWFNIYWYIDFRIFMGNYHYENFLRIFSIGNFLVMPFLIYLIPSFFLTRYIWFEKSRDRIFYGLFSKFQPRIYTTTSNADELKKYAELRDQGIITEEEFQSKKSKLLDL